MIKVIERGTNAHLKSACAMTCLHKIDQRDICLSASLSVDSRARDQKKDGSVLITKSKI